MNSMPEPQDFGRRRLDRKAWHNPLISIVVTHHNYAEHVEDALLSLINQTHWHWECVVVDDGSTTAERRQLRAIVGNIEDSRIRLIEREENGGQIPAFYTGLDATNGQFVCLLDPDDRYAETFLAELLAVHLNDTVFSPIACADQRILRGDEVITGIYGPSNLRFIAGDELPEAAPRRVFYHPPGSKGWHWTSTSGLMFRRAVLSVMRPHRPLAYMGCADSYLAQGAHRLGGALFLNRPLVYRGAHATNAWLSDAVYATAQKKKRADSIEYGSQARADVLEAIEANGAGEQLVVRNGRRGALSRWSRSLAKRWRRLTGGGRP